MEVRGGCGYIEEWPDPRILRDAQLGSIWEGTSNIVALDVRRAVRREHALEALRTHVTTLLDEAPPLPDARSALDRACALADAAQGADGEVLARQSASALYHVASAAAMAWEAGRLQDPHRLALARMVLVHRVLPRDPLQADATEDHVVDALLLDPAG